jgi:hypothetical protein
MVSLTGLGLVTIKALQAGDSQYKAAASVEQSFTVNPALLTVAATNKSMTYGNALPALTFTYTGFASGETDAVLTTPPAITTTATANSDAGNYPITLNGGSAANYTLDLVNGILTINKADQTINIGAIPNKIITDGAFGFVAGATSGLTLSYSITGPATLSGTTITLTGTAGTVTLTATQAGNINFNPTSKAVSFEVIDNRQTQSISFTAIPDQILETGQMSLSASASSGLAIKFELIAGPATISGNVVSFTGLGTVEIKASQSGNTTFRAAAPVVQSFDIVTITGLDEPAVKSKIYPNPATDFLHLEIDAKDAKVSIMSLDGREVLFVTRQTDTIDISTLVNGLYVVRVITPSTVTTYKIIKN